MKKQIQYTFFLVFGWLFCSCPTMFAQLQCGGGELVYDQTITLDDATIQTNNNFDFEVCPGWNIVNARVTVMARGDLDGDGFDFPEFWDIGTENTPTSFPIGNSGNPADECDRVFTQGPFNLTQVAIDAWKTDGIIRFTGAANANVDLNTCGNDLLSVRLEFCYTDCSAPVASCMPDFEVSLDAANPDVFDIGLNDINDGSSVFCTSGLITVSGSTFNLTCANIGNPVTYNLVVTDECGNSDECMTTVSVVDAAPPTAQCIEEFDIFLSPFGQAQLFTFLIDDGSFDNCDQFLNFSLDQQFFFCADVGVPQEVTLTVTDDAGLSNQCTSIVNVFDLVPPIVPCQDLTVELDAGGTVNLTPQDFETGDGFDDVCGVAEVTIDMPTLSCLNIGTQQVTITVTDVNGNANNCMPFVTVEENIPPVAICSNATVILDEFGGMNLNPAEVGGNSTDNCIIANLILSQSNFMCGDIGNNTVTLTALDASGNSDMCTATVTVLDETLPTPICQPHQAELDANGIATINLDDVLASATDNCGVMPGGQFSQSAFNCGNLGANPVTVSVIDVNGLEGNCTAVVTVVDLSNPTAVCQNLTIDLDVNGFAAITPNQIDAGSNDNCNTITLEASPNTFFCGNVGVNPVTLTVTDQSTNEATCTALVTVRDLIAPVALCQNVTTFLDENGNAIVTPAEVDNGSDDACGISSLVLDKTIFNCDDLGGNNPVVLTVTDLNGNVSSCNATVTVVDLIPAEILCRPPVNTITDAEICGAEVILLPPLVLAENCSIAQIFNSAPSIFPLGTTTVTWVFLDAGNNVSTCEQNVTINDLEAPEINCGNSFIAFTSWDNCGYPSSLLEGATATDNCGIATITDDAPFFFEPGQYMVNYTATDFSGNSSTCMQWVKIYDTTDPKLNSCPGDQLITATNDDGATATWPLPTGIDNCAGDLIWVSSHDSGDFFSIGETIVNYIGYDQYGNSVECNFIINVLPAPQPLTMNCLETIEISTQSEINLQSIAWNSPLVQSLCEACYILKSDDFEYVGGFEGHNYYLFDADEMSWESAKQLANDLGGYLTIIDSEKENNFLANELVDTVEAWIGLADIAGNGLVGWVDGSDFENPEWQEDFTLIINTPTGFILNHAGDWVIQPTSESNYFLFEIPCFELEMTDDNDLDVAAPNSETTVTYEITDMCGNTTTCDFQLVFTDEAVAYCTEGAIVTDSTAQHFINQFLIVDAYNNESGNDYGYGDFSDDEIILTPGEIFDIYADFGPFDEANPLYCRIWMDLNADGDFYDDGELIGEAIDVLNMQDELTVPTVDESITETRLRIAIARYSYPEPCGTYGNGEMEDYTITFDHENSPLYMQVNLQGQREGFDAKLSWVTQTNLDIEGYDIERSIDGVNFEKVKIGVADATTKGTPAIYNSKDTNPELGFNFYRLEVFPAEGTPFYTNIVSIKFNEEAQRMTVYPNPADEYVNVHVENADGQMATLHLYNALGQQVKILDLDELSGEDIQIPLDNLVDGNYYLHLTVEGQRTMIQKLVVDKLNGYRPGEK